MKYSYQCQIPGNKSESSLNHLFIIKADPGDCRINIEYALKELTSKGTIWVHPFDREIIFNLEKEEKFAFSKYVEFKEKFPSLFFSVSNLTKDTEVQFTHGHSVIRKEDKVFTLKNPFRICQGKECKDDISQYTFINETDYTIADFVADLRAPTPSAAAELAVTNIEDLENTINLYKNRLKIALSKKTEVMRLRFEKCMRSRFYKDPYQILNDYYILIDRKLKIMENATFQKLKDSKIKATKSITKLDTLSPLKTLARGYSIVVNEEQKVISSIKDLNSGDIISLKFKDGEKKAKAL